MYNKEEVIGAGGRFHRHFQPLATERSLPTRLVQFVVKVLSELGGEITTRSIIRIPPGAAAAAAPGGEAMSARQSALSLLSSTLVRDPGSRGKGCLGMCSVKNAASFARRSQL